jgi:hypothetical protein
MSIYEQIERRLQRTQNTGNMHLLKYDGKEQQYTFHGGWSMGYYEGREAALEDVLGMLEDAGMKPEVDFMEYLRKKGSDE